MDVKGQLLALGHAGPLEGEVAHRTQEHPVFKRVVISKFLQGRSRVKSYVMKWYSPHVDITSEEASCYHVLNEQGSPGRR